MSEPSHPSHRLSGKDFVKMSAICSECGPVPMRSRGKGRMACGKKLAEKHARWAKANPQKASRNRSTRSAHRLISFDGSTHTGVCPVCGTVGVVPKGRGWMCKTRAEQLWTVQQDAPQERCPECHKNFLSADGTCAYCSDRLLLDWSAALVEDERRKTEVQEMKQCAGDLGLIIDPVFYDARSTEGEHVSNPSLKTLGAGVPQGRSANSYIKSWWAENGHLVEGGL